MKRAITTLVLVGALAGTAWAAGGPAQVIEGTSGNDILHGGQAHDIEYGRQGDDRIWGGGASDVERGGRGNDLVNGREVASDKLFGGPGKDRCVGTANDFFSRGCEKVRIVEAV